MKMKQAYQFKYLRSPLTVGGKCGAEMRTCSELAEKGMQRDGVIKEVSGQHT